MSDVSALLSAMATERPGGVGVRDWSVYASRRRGMVLGVKDREAGNAHAPLTLFESSSARYTIVWEDGRVSRGRLEHRQIATEARQALDVARQASYEDPDAAQVSSPRAMPEVVLHDRGAARQADGDVGALERRLALVRTKVREHGFRTWSGSFSASEAHARIVTSAGLDAEVSGTAAGWHVSFQGEWGDGFSARAPDDDGEYASRLDRLATLVRCLARPAPPMKPGVHPVLLHPRVVEGAVLGVLLRNLDGATVAHGEGAFKADDFGSGRPVLREDLSFRVDPLRPLRAGSYRFSVEGVPSNRCTYIDRGKLASPVLDMKYGRRLGRPPTPLPYAFDTLDLESTGALALADAFAEAGGGVLALAVLGTHTQDPASGDFSLSAPQALLLGAEGPEGRIRGTLSGNLFHVLRSDDLRLVRFPGEHTPGMLFRCRVDPA